MKRFASHSLARHVLALGFLGSLLANGSLRGGEPFVPLTDDTILVRVPRAAGERATADLARSTLTDFPSISGAVRDLLCRGRKEADPQLLRRAIRWLESCPTTPRPTPDWYYLRAQARQGLHDFDGALSDLGHLLRENPRHAGGWLSKASLHQLRGEFHDSRHACLQLARWGDPFVSTVAAASLASLTSLDGSPGRRLEALMRESATSALPTELQAWGWISLGELHALHRNRIEAEAAFRKAIGLVPDDPYARTALADLLLADHRPGEVLALLADTRLLNHHVRIAEARLRLDRDGETSRAIQRELAEGFDRSAARGDHLHLREHARFVLRTRNNPAHALQLAVANWAQQKEIADLELLMDAAEAAEDRAVAEQARAWARTHAPAFLQHRPPNLLTQTP